MGARGVYPEMDPTSIKGVSMGLREDPLMLRLLLRSSLHGCQLVGFVESRVLVEQVRIPT